MLPNVEREGHAQLHSQRRRTCGTRGSDEDSEGTHIALVWSCAVAEMRGRCFPELQDSTDPEPQLLMALQITLGPGLILGGA